MTGGFCEYPPDIEMKYGGNWSLPGVYALHHIPTGLEYVGASYHVRSRLAQHASSEPAWKVRLRACIVAQEYGPRMVHTDQDVVLLHSPMQIAQRTASELQSALNVLELLDGITGEFDNADIVPLFLEYSSTAGLRDAEARHVRARRPVLNGASHNYYPSHACQGLANNATAEQAPKPVPIAEIKAIPIRKQMWRWQRSEAEHKYALDKQRRELSEAIESRALDSAIAAADRVYSEWVCCHEDFAISHRLDLSPCFARAFRRRQSRASVDRHLEQIP